MQHENFHRIGGDHLLVDLIECEKTLLDSIKFIDETLTEISVICNMKILNKFFHKFSPQGVSGVIVVEESHISIHTWPEANFASIDIYTCGDSSKFRSLPELLKYKFKSKSFKSSLIHRIYKENE